MAPVLRCLLPVALVVLLAPSHALAESFRVKAQVLCPASLTRDGSGWTVTDESFAAGSIQYVACAGILVEARDADDVWDEHCGGAFTDSRGFVDFSASCSDLTNRPDVYLRVSARSALDFSVGTLDYSFWDSLVDNLVTFGTGGLGLALQAVGAAPLPNWAVSHASAEWVTAEGEVGDGAVLGYGKLAVGDDFDAIDRVSHHTSIASVPGGNDNVAFRAARQLWAASFAMHRLHAGTQYVPMHFDYTVDHPWFGAPTTLWDTIVVRNADFAADPADQLDATAHEIGHVVHNTYHSGYSHWITQDAVDYAKSHSMCGSDTLELAWYEGFAHFISDYVFRAERRSAADATGTPYQPFRTGCGFGFAIEGNVRNFLSAMYFGLEERLPPAQPADDEFSCGAGRTRVNIGASWRCQWQRETFCAIGSTTLRDAQGDVDVCETCPDPLALPPGTGTSGPSTSAPPCPAGQLCLAFDGPLDVSPLVPAAPATPPPPTTITIHPDGSTTVSGQDGGGSSAGGGSPAPAQCQQAPLTCGPVAPLGAATSITRRSGPDLCTMHVESDWTPPVNPAGARTVRTDGTPGDLLAPNRSSGRSWFGLPSLDDMIELVAASGSGEHRLQEHWNASMRGFCQTTDTHGRAYFCNTALSRWFLQHTSALGTWTP